MLLKISDGLNKKTIMKKIFSILLLMPLISFSQDTTLIFSKVLLFDSIPKDEIYNNALIWCSKSFENSK